MKLYLDDIRDAPDKSWLVCRTAPEAIKQLQKGNVAVISLDHDLGSGQPTGYDVIKWIEKEVFTNKFTPPAIITVHSMNNVRKDNIKAAIKRIQKQVMINNLVEDYDNREPDYPDNFDQFGDN